MIAYRDCNYDLVAEKKEKELQKYLTGKTGEAVDGLISGKVDPGKLTEEQKDKIEELIEVVHVVKKTPIGNIVMSVPSVKQGVKELEDAEELVIKEPQKDKMTREEMALYDMHGSNEKVYSWIYRTINQKLLPHPVLQAKLLNAIKDIQYGTHIQVEQICAEIKAEIPKERPRSLEIIISLIDSTANNLLYGNSTDDLLNLSIKELHGEFPDNTEISESFTRATVLYKFFRCLMTAF